MAKKVKKGELENLIRECFTTVIKFPKISEAAIKFTDFKFNSIYAIVYYDLSYDKPDKDFIHQELIRKFKGELRKYVGENLKVHEEIENKKIIIQIDYEIID